MCSITSFSNSGERGFDAPSLLVSKGITTSKGRARGQDGFPRYLEYSRAPFGNISKDGMRLQPAYSRLQVRGIAHYAEIM